MRTLRILNNQGQWEFTGKQISGIDKVAQDFAVASYSLYHSMTPGNTEASKIAAIKSAVNSALKMLQTEQIQAEDPLYVVSATVDSASVVPTGLLVSVSLTVKGYKPRPVSFTV